MTNTTSQRPRVVIIGGGFGGLSCARRLYRAPCDITMIDRRNFHLFQPLLYQVATGGLSPANIAAPLRSILRRQRNIQVQMAEVTGFDLTQRVVRLADSPAVPFDYLVVASGATHHYFGQDAAWEPHAPGLKTIEEATEIRRKILSAFEAAERSDDAAFREKCLTFIVVGGGPTGVEMAGSIAELARHTMRYDFRRIDPNQARVILVENSPGILNSFHESLGAKAKADLQSMGVDVWNDTRLTDLQPGLAIVQRAGQEHRIPTANVVWAAGVKASPLGGLLAAEIGSADLLDRAGRVRVNQACGVDAAHRVFVIGDLASFVDPDTGKPLPGVAPVAMQQGNYVGGVIEGELRGQPVDDAFKYLDKGSMATIGRARAVMESGSLRMSGRIAWWAWLLIHILYLARFENRVLVLFQWFWNFITRNRTARLITGEDRERHEPEAKSPPDRPSEASTIG